MSKRCENYSVENKQCKFNYTPHPWIDSKDLNSRCDGIKTEKDCAWYKGYHLDIAGNDSRLKRYRARFRNEIINCSETPCEYCHKYTKCLEHSRELMKQKSIKEAKLTEELWVNTLRD